jgi:uncharacterized protein YbaR (Trm112 family)
MPLDTTLLKILVCPVDKGSLWYFEDELALYNPRLRRRYPIEDDVPVLLAYRAEPVTEAEHLRLRHRAETGGAQHTSGLPTSPLG